MSATYHEIASSYALWLQYADPMATTTEKEFCRLTTDERIQALTEAFGPEEQPSQP